MSVILRRHDLLGTFLLIGLAMAVGLLAYALTRSPSPGQPLDLAALPEDAAEDCLLDDVEAGNCGVGAAVVSVDAETFCFEVASDDAPICMEDPLRLGVGNLVGLGTADDGFVFVLGIVSPEITSVKLTTESAKSTAQPALYPAGTDKQSFTSAFPNYYEGDVTVSLFDSEGLEVSSVELIMP